MNCEEIQHELYAFGTLEAEERAELERHLSRNCAACTEALAAAHGLAAHLALLAPRHDPPAGLRAAVLNAAPVRSGSPASERARLVAPAWRWVFAVTAAAALALFVVTLGLLRQVDFLQAELRTVGVDIAVQKAIERELQKRLGEYREAMRLMSVPEAREVRFGPKQPSGRLFLQPRGLVMFASDFPQPPQGRTYELWLIASTQPAPIPAGVFDPNQAGEALHIWQQPIDVASIKAIAVSDEPPGGVPQPTGKILFSAPVR